MIDPSATDNTPVVLRRRMTISDVSLLVAATAIGLAPYRFLTTTQKARPLSTAPNAKMMVTITLASAVLPPLLIAWSAAILAIGMRCRAPAKRLRIASPGLMACVAALTWGLIPLGVNLVGGIVTGRTHPATFYAMIMTATHFYVAPAVSMAWIALALSGSWKPEPSWPDRFGRALGAIWIGVYCLQLLPTFI